MLKSVPKILSPELLKVISEMGHGDELVIADGNYPASSIAQNFCGGRLIRADGHGVPELLKAVLKLFPLDTYSEPNVMLMAVTEGDTAVPGGVPPIWDKFKAALAKAEGDAVKIGTIERFAFYERSKKAYAIVASGEPALYANIILKKGVVL
jgi:L-fucose mutarotase